MHKIHSATKTVPTSRTVLSHRPWLTRKLKYSVARQMQQARYHPLKAPSKAEAEGIGAIAVAVER